MNQTFNSCFKFNKCAVIRDVSDTAYELFPDPEVAAHIVDTQWALGNHDLALQLLRQKLEESPESVHLRELTQRLEP